MRCPWLLCGALLVALAPPLATANPQVKGKKEEKKVYQIPYALTNSQHIMVRLKINGKGPYNFIVDTGAPLLYVAVPVAKKIELEADKKGAATIKNLQIEGGPVFTNFKCHVETPFQLEGMNAMGMAGTEIHGMLGYTVLAHFRMKIDLRKDKMTWTRLDYKPAAPVSIGIKKNPTIDEMNNLGSFMKAYAKFVGLKSPPPPTPRGFLGVELAEKDGLAIIQKVLVKGPASDSRLKVGDRLLAINGHDVTTIREVMHRAAQITAGQEVQLTVQRGAEKINLKITAGEGL